MLDWLRQRPLSACCVQAASAYLQQHLLAGSLGLVGAADGGRMRGETKAGEEVFLFHSNCRLYWGGLGYTLG